MKIGYIGQGESMKRGKWVFSLLLLSLFIQSAYAQHPTAEKKRWYRCQVEIFGGLASLNPSDMNLRADYDTQYLHNQREFHLYYYPDAAQGFPSDEFRKLKSTLPFGFRLRYRLSRMFSISLGFKYFSKEQSSEVSAQYQWVSGRPYILDYQYSPYSLSTRAFTPLLGVHFLFGAGKSFGFEYFLTAGPLFAQCQYLVGITRLYSRDNNVINANETSYEIQGKSTGLSLNTGLRINVGIFRSLGLFCEGGYSYQTASNLSGQGTFIFYRYEDPETKYISDTIEWEGYWGVKETEAHSPLPSNEWEKDDARVSDFRLDLSGMFLQFGISCSFSFH
jgi:hypothetical protein